MKPTINSGREIPKRIRFRLLVSIPTIVVTFTIGSGFLVLRFTSHQLPSKMALFVAGGILVMAALACVSGVMLAYGITRPLKRLAMTAESLIWDGDQDLTEIKAENELGILTAIFNKAYISLNKLIQDRHILDTLPEGVISINSRGEITDLNRMAAGFLNLDLKQVRGKTFREIFSPSEDNDHLFHLIEEGLKGRESPLQELRFSIPGKRFDFFWTATRFFEGKEGGSKGVVVILKDPGEIKIIRNHLQKTEQLATLGTLASGVAHEVRNPLGSLRGLTELISEDLPAGDRKKVYTESMLKEVDRLNHLVEDILNFAQNPMSRVEPADISQVLSRTISLARYNFPEKEVEIKEDYQPGLPLIPADSERLTQAFLNLLNNAFEATPEGGEIDVRSQKSEVRGQGSGDRRPATDSIVITISDSGPGIPSDILERVFDPFYTTKEKGTGLGLFITQNIIIAHGGSVKVESMPRQGASFKVVLPVTGHQSPVTSHESPVKQKL